MPLRASPPEDIEGYVEPLVDVAVDGVVLVADLPGGHLVFHGLDHCGSPILVGSADIECVIAMKSFESCEDVSREHAPDDVPQVGDIVYVGEGRGNQNIALSGSRRVVVLA